MCNLACYVVPGGVPSCVLCYPKGCDICVLCYPRGCAILRVMLFQGVSYLACYDTPGGVLFCALCYYAIAGSVPSCVLCYLRGCGVYYCVLCYPRGCGVLSCVLYDILSQEVPLFYPLTSGVHLAFFVGIAMDMFLLSEHVEGKVRWAMESARFLCVVGMARSPCRFGALSQSCGRNRSDLLRRLRQRNCHH